MEFECSSMSQGRGSFIFIFILLNVVLHMENLCGILRYDRAIFAQRRMSAGEFYNYYYSLAMRPLECYMSML